jgi:hypothetical protein
LHRIGADVRAVLDGICTPLGARLNS